MVAIVIYVLSQVARHWHCPLHVVIQTLRVGCPHLARFSCQESMDPLHGGSSEPLEEQTE